MNIIIQRNRRNTGGSTSRAVHKEGRMPNNEPFSDMGERLLESDAAVALSLEGRGYHEFTIAPLTRDGEPTGEFVASAVKRVGATPYKAQAIGNTKADAARQLIRMIERD